MYQLLQKNCSLCYNPNGIITRHADVKLRIQLDEPEATTLCLGIAIGFKRNGLYISHPYRRWGLGREYS